MTGHLPQGTNDSPGSFGTSGSDLSPGLAEAQGEWLHHD